MGASERVTYEVINPAYGRGVFYGVEFDEALRGNVFVGVGFTTVRAVARECARAGLRVTPDPFRRIVPKPAPEAPPEPVVGESDLPPDFPARSLLVQAGFVTVASVQNATEEELRAVKGIGPAAARAIRAAAPPAHKRRSAGDDARREGLKHARTVSGYRMNPNDAAENVHDAVRALTEAGVKAWMQDGTLLGAVREGHVLKHDRDTDVGVMHDTWTPAADRAMRKAGFQYLGGYNKPDQNYHQKWKRAGIRMCVFHYYRNEDGSVYHGIRRDDYVFTYPQEPELAPIALGEFMILAPDPPEAWLEIKYGPGWRTPVKVWNCRTGPANATRTKP